MLSSLALVLWTDLAPYLGAVFAVGYFFGSIPFGLLFTRLAGAGDVRKIGSGNIGATNVLRTGNKWAAAATLVFDAGKGALPVLIARYYLGDLFAIFAALGAFLGHLFPIWLRFKGGKGVATFIGIALALYWPVGLLTCATWLTVALFARLSSLAALLAAIMTPIYFYYVGEFDVTAYGEPNDLTLFALLTILLAILIMFTHRQNIARLFAGTEPRIGK